jgi:hypothetical protein
MTIYKFVTDAGERPILQAFLYALRFPETYKYRLRIRNGLYHFHPIERNSGTKFTARVSDSIIWVTSTGYELIGTLLLHLCFNFDVSTQEFGSDEEVDVAFAKESREALC